MKCFDCGAGLTLNTKAKTKEWFCKTCSGKYVSVIYFSKMISEYEYNKLVSEINVSKVTSSLNCSICTERMFKVFGLLKSNEIETCRKCKMVWLNGGEFEKIQSDQNIQLNKKLTVQMPSTFERPIDIRLSDDETYFLGSHSFGRFFQSVINHAILSSIAKDYPIVAFFIGLILIVILFFIFIYFFRFFRFLDFLLIIHR